jgi:lysyl-tRNA synthetase class 2
MSSVPVEPVVGRVLAAGDGLLVLWTMGQATKVTAQPSACKAGDFVQVNSPKGDVRIIWSHPTGEWPPATPHTSRYLNQHQWGRLMARAQILERTREHFRLAGFLEVETPTLVQSAGTEVHLDPVPAQHTHSPGGHAETHYLITSPEYHMKRLLGLGSPPIFQICRVFRDGERGGHHRPEFTMLEWYRPWVGYERLMTDCEAWIRSLTNVKTLTYQGHQLDLTPPWPRMSFRAALAHYASGETPAETEPEKLLTLFVDRVEPHLGKTQPVFLTEFPISLASLARPKPTDPTVAERFELFAGGLELGNAFSELVDAEEQELRCIAENQTRAGTGKETMPLDRDFLTALKEGVPPSSGIAVGLDRVIMLMLNASTIDDVLAF